MTVIDEYLSHIDPVHRKELERIRSIALQVVPNAMEVISYGMPTLRYNGQSFLGFNIHKNHIGIYPYGAEEIEVFKDKLLQYGLSSGAIRVPFDKKIDEGLLKAIIKYRVHRISAKK